MAVLYLLCYLFSFTIYFVVLTSMEREKGLVGFSSLVVVYSCSLGILICLQSLPLTVYFAKVRPADSRESVGSMPSKMNLQESRMTRLNRAVQNFYKSLQGVGCVDALIF